MNRLGPSHRFRFDRIDGMLVSALFIVVAAYGLGYRLDWSEGRLEDDETVASVPAPAASRPQEELGSGGATLSQGPATAWAQSVEGQAWDSMTSELGRLAARHPGRVAIFLRDLRSSRTWSYHPDDLFPSASLIKVPVMAAVFSKIGSGDIRLNDRLTLRRRFRVGGSGSIKWRPDGTQLTVDELLLHMITESDNTATKMLLDAIGIGYAQEAFPKLGLLYTGIYPEGMSIKGGRVAHENYTTAREMTMLLERIYKGELVDPRASAMMLDILKHKKAVRSRLAKGLPVGWEIAHKTGLLRRACHDSALILSPNGDYALTVLTGQNRSYGQAKDFISRLGRVTFRHYKTLGSLAQGPRSGGRVALR